MNPTKKFKPFAIGITFALAISLSACSGEDANLEQAAPPVSEAPSELPGTETDNTGEQPKEQPTDEPSATPSGDENANGMSEAAKLIGSIESLAKSGKVPGSDYAAHTALFDEIEQDWGKPDSNESAGKGLYAAYKKKGITFGYNKGMIVFDVRSYASELQSLALKDIEAALGQADEKTANGSDDIYTYEVNKRYQLKFIIPESTGKVNHISVYSPEDTKNNMAG
ncbi:YjgB family protein [Paenibacillus harenae]|uniref:YjgB family protein n=1 Tax=Paenibacillus harenae TaxID=306543 RepID=UPI0003F8461B|nr:YjgB family protein [Paenibacillus harenae]